MRRAWIWGLAWACLAGCPDRGAPPGESAAEPATEQTATAPAPRDEAPMHHALPESPPRPLTGLEPLVEAYGALGLERQWHLNERLTLGGDARLDREAGQLVLPGAPPLRVQILGSRAEDEGTWTWAWADQTPPALAARAHQLRDLGLQRDLAVATTSTVELTENLGFAIGVVAAGLGEADGWYFTREGDRVTLVTIEDEAVPPLGPPTTQGLSAVFVEFVDRFNVDHRRAMEGYLSARGFTVEALDGQHDGQPGARLLGRRPGGPTVVASFDARGRFRGLRTDDAAPPP